jgi:hypothetical protein
MADVAGNNAEQRMRFRFGNASMLAVEARGTTPKFCEQVFPFVEQLTLVLVELPPESGRGDFGSIEAVSTPVSFLCDAEQEGSNCRQRPGVRTKSGELWMVSVTTRATGEYFLGEQCFPPGGDQAFGIEVAGMDCPESHPEIVAQLGIAVEPCRVFPDARVFLSP